MEALVVVSKLNKHVKDKSGMSTSANFLTRINEVVHVEIDKAIETAQAAKRKTVMGRDFSNYSEGAKPEVVLAVASKVKSAIKEKSGLSTSSQVMDTLTLVIEGICKNAVKYCGSINSLMLPLIN